MSDLPVSVSCEMVSSGLCAVRGIRNIPLILGNTLVVSYFLCTLYGCVDAVLRLLGVFHDVLYGDVAPVRPGSTLGVVSVRLSRSLFVPGRQLKKGGSPPFPPALGSHTRVATKRRVGFRSPASHTRVATARAERDAPTPMYPL